MYIELTSGYSLRKHQDGRVVKALDSRSNGRVVRVGSNPTPGKFLFTLNSSSTSNDVQNKKNILNKVLSLV